MSTQIKIDDRDSAVVYSPGWIQEGDSNEYKGTNTWTDRAKQRATLSFRGISVGVFGTIRPYAPGVAAPETAYTIDGSTTTVSIEVQQSAMHMYQQQLYQSPVLSDGQHTLAMTTLLANTSSYILDFFIVTTAATTPLPSSVTPTSSSAFPSTSSAAVSSTSSGSQRPDITRTSINGTIFTVTVTTPSAMANVLSTNSPTASGNGTIDPNQTGSMSNQNRNPIIFGVVGGVVGLIIVIVIYFWRRRRKSIKRDNSDDSLIHSWNSSQVFSDGIAHSVSTPRRPNKFQLEQAHIAHSGSADSPRSAETVATAGGPVTQPSDYTSTSATSPFDDAPPAYSNIHALHPSDVKSSRNSSHT